MSLQCLDSSSRRVMATDDAAPVRFRQGGLVFDFVKPALRSFALVAAERAAASRQQEKQGYLLLFADQQPYACRLNDRNIQLQPGDLLVVKPGDWHEEIRGTRLGYYAIGVDLGGETALPVRDVIFRADIAPEQQVVSGHAAAFRRLLGRMRDEAQRQDRFIAHLQNALALELLCQVVRVLPPGSLAAGFFQRSPDQNFRERLMRLFELNRGGTLSVPHLAAEMGVGVRTLTKRCQEVLGRPPKQAFTYFKMAYAAHTLRSSDAPIKSISHDLGFQNQYHFSRRFRGLLGIAPSQYRASAHERFDVDDLFSPLMGEGARVRSA